MNDRLTDEQVADLTLIPTDFLVGQLAREVQKCWALRPDCPTCEGARWDWKASADKPYQEDDPVGDNPCPDCTDGKMPLDKWVALLVETIIGLADQQAMEDDWYKAVLKMVPKVVE